MAESIAQKFMRGVFEHIAHGDDAHRAWLRDKCEELAGDLDVLMKPVASTCHHQEHGIGPRLPLQFGSAPTRVCALCGKWTDARDSYRWREPVELLLIYAEGVD